MEFFSVEFLLIIVPPAKFVNCYLKRVMGGRLQTSFAALNLLRKLQKGCGKKAGLQFAWVLLRKHSSKKKTDRLAAICFLFGAGDGSRTHVLSLEG